MSTICDMCVQSFPLCGTFLPCACMNIPPYAYIGYGTLTPYMVQPSIFVITCEFGGSVEISWFCLENLWQHCHNYYTSVYSNDVAMSMWYLRPCICGLEMSVGHCVCHPVTYLLIYCFSLFCVHRPRLCEEPTSKRSRSQHRITRITP